MIASYDNKHSLDKRVKAIKRIIFIDNGYRLYYY